MFDRFPPLRKEDHNIVDRKKNTIKLIMDIQMKNR